MPVHFTSYAEICKEKFSLFSNESGKIAVPDVDVWNV